MQAILEAMHEAGDCAWEAGVPLVLSHHKCAGPSQWGRTVEVLALVDELALRQPIALDAYPYVAGSTVLREDLVDGIIDVRVTWSDPHPECTGRLLADVAVEWGVDQKTASRRLQPGGACYFQMNEEDVARVIAHPRTMTGSDGLPHDRHPHPRLWGAFPRVLARYWRERRLFTLEQAVYKMTGLTAQNFRIRARSLLRAGWFADLVVFDPRRIADTATYDRPVSASVGVAVVYVNGRRAYAEADGLRVQARAGRRPHARARVKCLKAPGGHRAPHRRHRWGFKVAIRHGLRQAWASVRDNQRRRQGQTRCHGPAFACLRTCGPARAAKLRTLIERNA